MLFKNSQVDQLEADRTFCSLKKLISSRRHYVVCRTGVVCYCENSQPKISVLSILMFANIHQIPDIIHVGCPVIPPKQWYNGASPVYAQKHFYDID